MIDEVLTKYNKKFNPSQLDFEAINSNKLFYKIYNNKIEEPLHKFWFSVPNVKYLNNYENHKKIRFVMNNKSENVLNLINFIIDLGSDLIDKFKNTFPSISIDYPWKENSQFPLIFTFYSNESTIVTDSDSYYIALNALNQNDSYSIIFEINYVHVKITDVAELDVKQTFNLKFNFTMLLIKTDKKKNLKDYNFSNHNAYQFGSKSSITYKSTPEINESKIESKNNFKLNSNANTNANVNESNFIPLRIDQNLLESALRTLKKVSNMSQINNHNHRLNDEQDIVSEYIGVKNDLKKVETTEKTLLDHLKKKDKKKKKKTKSHSHETLENNELSPEIKIIEIIDNSNNDYIEPESIVPKKIKKSKSKSKSKLQDEI
jgi:hypothetical protein